MSASPASAARWRARSVKKRASQRDSTASELAIAPASGAAWAGMLAAAIRARANARARPAERGLLDDMNCGAGRPDGLMRTDCATARLGADVGADAAASAVHGWRA